MSGHGTPLRAALFPEPTGEPGEYLTMLAHSLRSAGVSVQRGVRLTGRWGKVAVATDVDVVHLHWLEFIAPSDPTPRVGILRTHLRGARLLLTIWRLRRRGVPVVWTIHNLHPHEPCHPRSERLLRHLVLRMVDRAIVHSKYAREQVTTSYGPGRDLSVIPHGNYIGAYPTNGSHVADLRRHYRLPPNGFVYLSFGQVRRYKRIPEIVRAFAQLSGDDIALLIVGEARDRGEERRLREAVGSDPRVRLDLRRVAAAEVGQIHSICDGAVFAYEDVFSSGSVLLALSYGLPIVAPEVGTAAEIAEPPAAELIGPAGLVAALSALRDAAPQRRAAALATARKFDWAPIGASTAALYERARRDAAHAPAQ